MLDGLRLVNARNRVVHLLRRAQVDVVFARLQQLQALSAEGAEFELRGHGVHVADDRRLHVAGNASTGDGRNNEINIGQRHGSQTEEVFGVFVAGKVDYGLIYHSHCSVLLRHANALCT